MESIFNMKKKIMQSSVIFNFSLDIFEYASLKTALSC